MPENKLLISFKRALSERLMPENKLFTSIYREGKLPNNKTNSGIHRCENVGFSVWKTRVNFNKVLRFP